MDGLEDSAGHYLRFGHSLVLQLEIFRYTSVVKKPSFPASNNLQFGITWLLTKLHQLGPDVI